MFRAEPRLVVVAAATALLLGCSPNPVATASPSVTGNPIATGGAPSATTSSPTAAPSPTPPPAATSWDQVFKIERGSIGDLIAGPDGLIAPACIGDEQFDCARRLVVSSSDAQAWQAFDVDSPADVYFGSLHHVGNRVFALGYGHYGADGGAVIHTSVDGRSWSRVESNSFRGRSVTRLIDAPSGIVAIGYEAPIDSDNTSGFLIWPVRKDGSFGIAQVIRLTDGPPLVSGAMWTGEEFLAWGVRDGPSGNGPTTLLASPDGKVWTVRAEISAPKGADVQQIVAVGDRLVAVGYEGRTYPIGPRAWTSTDRGRSWRLSTVPPDNAAIYAVAVDSSGLIARGTAYDSQGSHEQTVSWISERGTAWTRLPDDMDTPAVPGFRASTRATLRDQTCVAGTFFDETASSGAIYCRAAVTE